MIKTKIHKDPLPLLGLMHLGIVYVVWSSTYLAMRILVAEGSGFTPFTAGAARMIIASIIILIIAYCRNSNIWPKLSELPIIILSGILFWITGNGMIMWAEQHAHSGLAALMASTTPIWAAFLESILARRRPSWQLIASLMLGLAGIAVLMRPALANFARVDVFSGLALVCASISIAVASVIQSRKTVHISGLAMSGWQHLFAFFGFLLIALFIGDPFPHPTQAAWLAWGYLVIFGSVFAFTAYITAIKLLPINIVMTYAYVNPVLALFLGWLLLNEPITYWTIAGAILVLAAIVGVFRAQIFSIKGEIK
jgi:drug/metabolite transporter (DMT)-like permease